MSSLVLMRVLESAPGRYDRGMRWLSLGRWERRLDALAEAALPVPGNARVLELGCGTGALTARLVRRAGHVLAIDQSPEMLDRARTRLGDVPASQLELRESTAAEIDALAAGEFDAIAASLVFSEMSAAERRFVLREALRLLRPGGLVAISDEVRPRRIWQRLLHALFRLPFALVTWLITGTTTRPLTDLAGEMRGAGLRIVSERRGPLGSFALVIAERPA